ncbi:DnaJ-domain-containing protein [Trametes meyenii]|nr:DnaJ-domain-containing protein [Trametes meyenii]
MSVTEEDVNPYDLLGLTMEASEQEIRTAYRQRSLKVHPDRNRGNPDAARKFHELHQAQELLMDPLRRLALDAKLRLKEAKKARFAQFDAKRKVMVEDLEERERALKKARTETEAQKKERWRENERIMDEGRRLREEREKELLRKEREREEVEKQAQAASTGLDPPSLGSLDTTVRVKYTLSSHPMLTSAASVHSLLCHFGPVDDSSIVLSLKPAPPKKPKRGTALVPFKQIVGAFAAVYASGRADSGLADIEVDWAEGKEPELIGWLKRMGKLGTGSSEGTGTTGVDADNLKAASAQTQTSSKEAAPNAKKPPSSTQYSSFPSTFVSPISPPPLQNLPPRPPYQA